MNLARVQKIGFFLQKNRIPLFPKLIELLIFLIYNSRVSSKTKIGKGTSFAYLGIGTVIHKDTVIGENCTIGQGITIGGRGGKRGGVPQVGDKVYIGAGARILGPIIIGNNVIIGPNSVIIQDVPSNSIVVGIPGKIIKSDIENLNDFL